MACFQRCTPDEWTPSLWPTRERKFPERQLDLPPATPGSPVTILDAKRRQGRILHHSLPFDR